MQFKKKVERMAEKPDTLVCPKCGHTNDTSAARTLQVDMRPVLTKEVFAFPDALAEVQCLQCTECGYWICLDYRIELDDNPEIDLNPA
jgi:DNA-directed RNA polymerase subunit RPC12/RpoP